jgi:cardiolipin synthase
VTEPGEDRLWTIPNGLSLIRLLCVPLFLWLLFGKSGHAGRYPAALLLGALGATDWVDGYVARHFNQVSTLGKILDPTADRLLLGVGVIGIFIDHAVPTWIALIVIAREALVSAVAVGLALAGARRIDVQWAGKAGTFAMMVAFPLFLASHSNTFWRDVAGFLAWVFVLPALCFSLYATVTYVPLAKRALAEGRVGSEL